MTKIEYRKLTSSDLPAVMELSRGFCEEMGWSFDYQTVLTSYLVCIENNGFFWGAMIDGKIVGVAAGRIFPSYMDASDRRCTEMVWHSDVALNYLLRAKVMLGLLDIMIQWAKENNLPLVIGSSVRATQRLLERRGFQIREVVYGH